MWKIYCHTNYRGNYWLCDKLDRGKDVISPEKGSQGIWKETSLTPGVIPRGQARLAKAVGNVVETQLLTPEYMGEKLLSEESEKRV